MSTDIMIQADGLTKRFGAVRALDNVSFEVKKGEVVGFLGPNGAGKSTTMRILTCFISPTAGTASVRGHDVFDEPLEVRRSIGYLPQRAPLYTDMKVYEYLSFAAHVRGLDDSTFRSRLKKVVEVCGLAQVLGSDIGTLSHGYRQRVGLGQALIHDPAILILDEPTSDLDPNEKAEVLRYIKEIGKDRTILLSTHNLSEVEEACARAIIVSKGRVVADGPLDEIRARTGNVRYTVTIDEQHAEAGNKPPTATAVQEALERMTGAGKVRELPTDESAHKFELTSGRDGDLRAEIFRLVVAKNWTLLELRREAQSLDAVFRDLTRGDERLDRGAGWAGHGDEPDEDESDEDESDEDESGEDEPDDDESDEDEPDDDESDEDEPKGKG
ncbi:MAG: ATP-binding cassette domain-containing protein [Sorangiineae bacterium]|nr:ATP-binding cassette domain-containing protein [Polyangiaceae bacterium]MEB2321818.1 ATP-binding cassette domain-containing protein [Sorangiineae bacterium]